MTIRSELESRIIQWAAAQSPKIPVAIEDTAFTKPVDYSPYLEVFLRSGPTKDVTIDGTRQRNLGIFQINVWTKSGEGRGKAERIVAAIVALYPIVPKTGTVSIDNTPNDAAPHFNAGWTVTPVTMPYRQEV